MGFPNLSVAILAAGIITAVAVVVIIARHIRQQHKDRHRLLVEFGFVALPSFSPDVKNKLKTLHNLKNVIRFKNIYRRRRADYDVYFFDVVEQRNSSSPAMTATAISDRLNLPRFSLYPRIKGDGFLVKMTMSLMAAAVGKLYNCKKVDLPDNLADKYLMMAENPAAVNDLFRSNKFQRVTGSENVYFIEAAGPVFRIGRFAQLNRRENYKFTREKLYELLDQTNEIFRALNETLGPQSRLAQYQEIGDQVNSMWLRR